MAIDRRRQQDTGARDGELAERGVGPRFTTSQSMKTLLRKITDADIGADAYYRCTLSIPIYPGLSDGDLETIAGHIRAVLRG